MALSFSNEQLKNLTRETLLLPELINNPDNGLKAQKQKIVDAQVSLFETDSQNSVFTTHFSEIAEAYHDELRALNGDQKTSYDNQNILDGGKGTGPHFPSTWVNFNPKVIPSNTGLPVSANPNDTELVYAQTFNDVFNELKNGFTDGILDDSTTSTSSGQFEMDDTLIADLAVGQRIVLTGSGLSIYGEVTDIVIATGTATVSYTNFSGAVTLPPVSRVRNFYPGFTNAERGYQTVPDAPEYRDYLISQSDAAITNWKTKLEAQELALQNNDDTGASATQNGDALLLVQDAIADIEQWDAQLLIDVNGKYTDTGITLITNLYTLRNTEVPSRVTEVNSSLGSLSQSSDGSFTGAGVYLQLFTWIDIRISKAGGTLFQANNVAKGIPFFDEKIAKAEKQLNEYNSTFAITRILVDTEIGQTVFGVESLTDFSVGQSVKVMDNNSVVYSRSILSINATENEIEINQGIPVELAFSALARIVRQR